MIKKWFHKRIDNYIINYHSDDYIRRSLIQDEITKRIDSAIDYNDTLRDTLEMEKLAAQRLKFDIERSGFLAELDKMTRTIEKVMKMRSELKDLYYRTFQRAKDLAMVTAENKHEGTNIIESVAASVGKLDIIGSRAKAICKEFEDNDYKDENILRVRDGK